MADSTFNIISLFSGGGGLDLGVRLAVPNARTVVFVEREEYAAAVLVARMAKGNLDVAPIATDVRHFDGRPWNGKVSAVVGGFPCQDISVAGRGDGIREGNRSGLWYEFARIIREVGPEYVFVENVRALLIRGLDIVLGDLADAGYDAEWGVFSAAEVGAPHKRERLFILAHRADNGPPRSGEARERGTGFADGSGSVDDSASARRGDGKSETGGEVRDGTRRKEFDGRRGELEDPARIREHGLPGEDGGRRGGVCEAGDDVADATRGGFEERGESSRRDGLVDWSDESLGHAESGEGDGRKRGDLEETKREGRRGDDAAHGTSIGFPRPFPPGPGDADGWREVLAQRPDLAPAIKSGIRNVANELAGKMDVCMCPRVDRLRLLGNGVVPATAALAFTELYAAMMKSE